MSAYEALLFLHVTSVAFWLGAELLVEILVHRAERQGNPAAMRRLFDEFNTLDPTSAPWNPSGGCLEREIVGSWRRRNLDLVRSIYADWEARRLLRRGHRTRSPLPRL